MEETTVSLDPYSIVAKLGRVYGAIPSCLPFMRGHVAPLLFLLVCVAAVNVPFINQAFHMDDGIYLTLARNVHRSFWFPQDRPTYFEGLYVSDLASTEHPWPLTSYLLALTGVAGNFSEIPLHLGFLVFPLALACSMYAMARRFTVRPISATLLFLLMPVVFVLSHTLMTDIPLLTFWVICMSLVSYGVDSRKIGWVWLGAFAAALACLISYSGLCLIPLSCLYAALRRNRRALIPIVILPASVLGVFITVSSIHYHRFTPGMLLGYYFLVQRVLSPGLLIQKTAFVIAAIGGVTAFPLCILAVSRAKRVMFASAAAVLMVCLTEVSKYGMSQRALFVVLFTVGLTAIIEIAQGAASSLSFIRDDSGALRDEFFLSVWFLSMLIFCIAAYMTGSARYCLPATPPLVLLVVRRMERLQRAKAWIAAGILLGGLLSLLLASADYQFAQIYRDFASNFKRAYSIGRGNLWFAGEWGFRTYLEQTGGQELGCRDPRPLPGDRLVVPTLATPYLTLFSDSLNLKSIVLVAPSQAGFDIAPLPGDSVLICMIGMPFYAASDGMDFHIRFLSPAADRVLFAERLLPADGRRWRSCEIPLQEIAGKPGRIVFTADVGATGKADADWVAVGRARICHRGWQDEPPMYDFLGHLDSAHIQAVPGLQYHTPQNAPVFALNISLEQEPAVILRGTYDHSPSCPVRLLDSACHAGFWSSGWGVLPFSFAERGSVLESISIYEITRRVDAYGELMPSWYH